ncbi:hypothetical protein QA639_35625 [Bradyrhizobium pachyrhizi]|uniref:DNA -binding domain-containing protein n=1 Tax=Bradyrhizobium pachyrhizi TaxID=280333 RepID=UPI0024B18963|nr:DUF2285 domain-containing protein [Bradyrhizobium pachyrhizi]WFU54844.1 hypothetical protein QA639_35625 [Bradyrhizobium pachyrhizi]
MLDAHIASGSYRIIAALFAQKRILDRAWKMRDLRNRTIRLTQSDLALVRTITQACAVQAQGRPLLCKGYRKIIPASSASP